MSQTLSIVNDFRNGMVDEQFGYRPDVSIYNTSASLLENVVVMHAGGLRQRPGLKQVALNSSYRRLIPFVISVEDSYLLVLAPERLHIFQRDDEIGWRLVSGIGFTIPYKDADIPSVRFTQDNARLVMVHPSYPPYIVSKTDSDAFRVAAISLDTSTDRVDVITGADGEDVETDYQYDYGGLFTQNDFPSVCTFCSNRLWFGGSKEHPGRLWASQPFKYDNFQDFAYYKVVDETVTTEQYLKAIEAYTNKVVDNGDGTETRTSKTVSPEGYVVITTGVYNKDTGALIGSTTTETFDYSKPATSWEEIVREDSAMVLDLASDRDEEIRWIGYVSDLIMVGTASSEWAMPYSITPQSASIFKAASYGGRKDAPLCYGARNIFYVQAGGRRLRSIVRASDQTAFQDLTIQCGDVLEGGVADMAWQRVPEPRLYVCRKDGGMSVLCYDEDYGLNAWVRWTFAKTCVSVAVVDNEDGQDVLMLFSDGTLGILDDSLMSDFGVDFQTRIVTNHLDSVQTMILNKKAYSVNVCSGGTRFVANKEGLPLREPQSFDHRLIPLAVTNSNDFRDGFRIELQGMAGEALRVHAVITLMEVF